MNSNKLTPPAEYTSTGYRFSLVKYENLPCTEKVGLERVKAIYVAKDTDKMNNIEVVVLREGKLHPMSEEFKSNPEGTKLHLPGSSEWGEYGWSFRSMGRAEERFNKIEK